MRRNGALKMGGTYWYFQYRLDGEFEHHDPVEPSTTTCPLLPGQEVNILEVPSEPQGPLREIWESNVFTLDPNAKYNSSKPPVRPKPTPLASDTLSSDMVRLALPVLERQRAHAGTSAPPPTATLEPPENEPPKTSQGLCMPFPSSSSLMAKIFRLRGSKSAPEVDGKSSGARRGPFKSFWRRSTEGEEKRQSCRQMPTTPMESQAEGAVKTPHWDSSEWPPAVTQAAYVAPWIADSTTDRVLTSHTSHSLADQSTIGPSSELASQMLHEDVLDQNSMRRSSTNSKPSAPGSSLDSANIQSEGQNIFGAPTTTSTPVASADIAHGRRRSFREANLPGPDDYTESNTGSLREGSPFVLPIQTNTPPIRLSEGEKSQTNSVTRVARSARPPSLLHDSRVTLESLYRTSPMLDGQLSPHYLSQPESPSVRDFDEAWESESQSRLASQSTPGEIPPVLAESTFGKGEFELLPMPQLPSPGFQVYSLPEAEHASSLTLRKLPSDTFTESHQRSPSSQSHRFVQSWDDGSDQRHLTALDELVDDLGHLGRIIT
ncbi:MAG: hypothetical protein Q9221_005497 [Calogaya cf. arnoldii]